ncbi:colicin release lysis protein (plasmid) [Escherichia coli]|nr:colicin release lysis protein [Escherichia coli]
MKKKDRGIDYSRSCCFVSDCCQNNYVRDVQGGTIAPSSSSKLTGVAIQ